MPAVLGLSVPAGLTVSASSCFQQPTLEVGAAVGCHPSFHVFSLKDDLCVQMLAGYFPHTACNNTLALLTVLGECVTLRALDAP